MAESPILFNLGILNTYDAHIIHKRVCNDKRLGCDRMKIIKTAAQSAIIGHSRNKANIGCNVCPCCGESKSNMVYIRNGLLNKGISSGISKSWVEGFFHPRHIKVDCYKCYSCGAEWESEPYQWV